MLTIKDLLLNKIEEVALRLTYDFLYEDMDDEFICQIIKRDADGGILGTPLTLKLEIDEEKGKGEVVYYHEKGEFHRQNFSIKNPETIAHVVFYIHERLSVNLKQRNS